MCNFNNILNPKCQCSVGRQVFQWKLAKRDGIIPQQARVSCAAQSRIKFLIINTFDYNGLSI